MLLNNLFSRKIESKFFLDKMNRNREEFIEEYKKLEYSRINILFDSSMTMDFGCGNEFNDCKKLLKYLSCTALYNNNKLNLYNFKHNVISLMEEVYGEKSFENVVNFINRIKPGGELDFSKIGYYMNYFPGTTVIISDFSRYDFEQMLDILRLYKQKISVIQVISSEEINLNGNLNVKLINKKTGKAENLRINRRVKEIYFNKLNEMLINNEKKCEQRNVKYIFIPTNEINKILNN